MGDGSGDRRGRAGRGSYPYHLGVVPGPALTAESRRRPASVTAVAATIVVVLGAVGLLVSAYGVASQVLPRTFTGAQQATIANWEVAGRWRSLPAGTIFPASVRYRSSAVLGGSGGSPAFSASRVGIAKEASCRAAVDPAAAGALVREGCQAVLRATYVDATDSYAVTVGVAVFADNARATAAKRQIAAASPRAGRLAPGVRVAAFTGTPAAYLSNGGRQLTGNIAAGPYLVMFTVGYTDGRPRVAIAADAYADAELTSMGTGVAKTVATVLGRRPPAPHCPGTPGC